MSIEDDSRRTSNSLTRRRLYATGLVTLVLATTLGYWMVSVNQVHVRIDHRGTSGPRLVVAQNDSEPIVISVDPPRRADGTEVLLDGGRASHPPGPQKGELLWFVGNLQPGVYSLEVRVPRPTWRSAIYAVEIEVQPNT